MSSPLDDHSNSFSPEMNELLSGETLAPFYPHLAAQIGVMDSLLLLQLSLWINDLTNKIEMIEDIRWLKLSPQEIFDLGFTYVSPKTIKKTIDRLVKRGLIEVKSLPNSKTRLLTLNYDNIDTLDGIEVVEHDTEE
jgi:hypothetical protein